MTRSQDIAPVLRRGTARLVWPTACVAPGTRTGSAASMTGGAGVPGGNSYGEDP